MTGMFPCRAHVMSSQNYRINVDSINIGGGKQASGNYRNENTAGEIATGISSSISYKMSAGYQAMWDYPPGLAFVISDNTADLGILSIIGASTDTTSFSVSTNAVGGYVVCISGDTLTLNVGGHDIDALTGQTASSPGTEQFGINLVANSNPSVGANPSGGRGVAASDYDTANQFKYVSGDTIASADIYSQNTDFIISYLGNMSNATAAGNYRTNLTLIATAKF